ncbi:MAG: hypothetical protein WC197_09455 [Candidatus Gastranaerophilaceae bacterium]|jgi:hypothetical protein
MNITTHNPAISFKAQLNYPSTQKTDLLKEGLNTISQEEEKFAPKLKPDSSIYVTSSINLESINLKYIRGADKELAELGVFTDITAEKSINLTPNNTRSSMLKELSGFNKLAQRLDSMPLISNPLKSLLKTCQKIANSSNGALNSYVSGLKLTVNHLNDLFKDVSGATIKTVSDSLENFTQTLTNKKNIIDLKVNFETTSLNLLTEKTTSKTKIKPEFHSKKEMTAQRPYLSISCREIGTDNKTTAFIPLDQPAQKIKAAFNKLKESVVNNLTDKQ